MNLPSRRDESLWVRMDDWIPVEAEMPEPVPGALLEGTGVRIGGAVKPAGPVISEGLVRCENRAGDTSRTVDYVVTGSAVSAEDFSADTGSGSQHSGVDIVLSVNGFLVQVQFDGWARDVTLGSRISVRGELSLIAYYEWDGFGLVDTRGSWLVEESLRVPGPSGGFLLRLRPAPTSP